MLARILICGSISKTDLFPPSLTFNRTTWLHQDSASTGLLRTCNFRLEERRGKLESLFFEWVMFVDNSVLRKAAVLSGFVTFSVVSDISPPQYSCSDYAPVSTERWVPPLDNVPRPPPPPKKRGPGLPGACGGGASVSPPPYRRKYSESSFSPDHSSHRDHQIV